MNFGPAFWNFGMNFGGSFQECLAATKFLLAQVHPALDRVRTATGRAVTRLLSDGSGRVLDDHPTGSAC